MISSDVEGHLRALIEAKCRELGFGLHAVDCVEDHLHLLVALKPNHTVSEVAKNLKGSSSPHINKEMGLGDVLYWPRGYGVLSLRNKDVPVVAEYVRNQKQHHRANDGLTAKLERLEAG